MEQVNIRRIALDIVSEVVHGRRMFSDSMQERTAGIHLDTRDRALLYEISSGVVRHKATLDNLIGKFSSRPLSAIEEPVLSNLRLGAYQLVYLDRVPQHAAVHETVEIMHKIKPEAVSFTNAVLRAMAASIDKKIPTVTPMGEPGTLLPIGGGWCRFREKVCPDQAEDFRGFFEMCLSYPRDFADIAIRVFGKAHAFQIGMILNEPAPLYVRVNAGKISRDEYMKKLADAGVAAEKGCLECSVLVEDGGAVVNLPGYAEGEFIVQDETAQRVARVVRVGRGERILDLCAAPGGKTTHLAELNPDAKIAAVDNDSARMERLKTNIGRLTLKNIEAVVADARDFSAVPPGPYKAVVVDAPCSNTGVYRRKPDARWNFSKKMMDELIHLQVELLTAAAGHVASGGTLVYSTCSILPMENEKRVLEFLASRRDFELAGELSTMPRSNGPDGGYFAVLKRIA
jgi:16S rRNA (cytosine967-C5)-methyltransferase